MSDYIKREDAIGYIKHVYHESVKFYEVDEEEVIDSLVEALNALPSADVVEVVRCKDCNNADYAGCPKGRCYCMEHGTYFNSDDYCSYGEREDGEKE